jgi:hypothetical protein
MRLYRILSEQQRCREQVGRAQDRLKDRDEAIYSADLYVRERRNKRCKGEYCDGNANSDRSLLRRGRHQCDHDRKIAIRGGRMPVIVRLQHFSAV